MLFVRDLLSHGASWRTFDFLGFNVRRYATKPLIKPSKAAQRRIRERLRTEFRSLRGSNAQAVIRKLNPIIRGWANYYRTQVSSEVFDALDQHLWRLTWKWARYSHQNKSKSWVFAQYYGKFNKSRQDRWVFGDRKSGAYLHKFSWTRIVRHHLVYRGASPDDPALADYWAKRRRRTPLPINKTTQELIEAQEGRCQICGGTLIAVDDRPQNPREWEKWLANTRHTVNMIAVREPGTSDDAEPRLVHADCRTSRSLALHNAYQPTGLA
jgi:RNA-directed DNA polymerase